MLFLIGSVVGGKIRLLFSEQKKCFHFDLLPKDINKTSSQPSIPHQGLKGNNS